eukprot:TRINITY_DN64594_c0_g1_i1.p1 TRINITY_DN64594_c0_g1~~TRINITY_DN64594_c0_g1_i1.p1  ORF type:complete len:256 (-),score=50.09 TRINITY_DN64594_c0_g1_i1:55-822(-)
MPDWETVKASLPVDTSDEHKRRRQELWRSMNVTRSKYLALFELDAGIQKVLDCQELFDAKPVIRRAHAYAREVNPSGPKDKLEFCEFRLLFVYLKGFFEVYQLFTSLDSSKDMVLSFAELEGAKEKLANVGIQMGDPQLLWKTLKGGNDEIDFGEFADWAARQGLAGPELLETITAEYDQEMKEKLKATFKHSPLCIEGKIISVKDMMSLLKKLDPFVTDAELNALMESSIVEDDSTGVSVSVDRFVDDIMITSS